MDILSCSGHAVVFFFSIGVFVDLFCKRRVLQQLPRACLQAWLKSYERKPVGNAQCFSRCHGQTRKRHDSVLSWLWGLWALWLSIWLHTGAAFQRKTDLKQFCVFELDAVMPFVACLWEGIFKECTAPADFGWLGGCLVSFISLFLAGLETTSLGFWGRSLLFLELACATLLPSFFFFWRNGISVALGTFFREMLKVSHRVLRILYVPWWPWPCTSCHERWVLGGESYAPATP